MKQKSKVLYFINSCPESGPCKLHLAYLEPKKESWQKMLTVNGSQKTRLASESKLIKHIKM